MKRCERCGLTAQMHFVKNRKGKYAGFESLCPIKRVDSWWTSQVNGYRVWKSEFMPGRSDVWTGTTNYKEATKPARATFTQDELRDVFEILNPLAA